METCLCGPCGSCDAGKVAKVSEAMGKALVASFSATLVTLKKRPDGSIRAYDADDVEKCIVISVVDLTEYEAEVDETKPDNPTKS